MKQRLIRFLVDTCGYYYEDLWEFSVQELSDLIPLQDRSEISVN